MQKQSIVSGKTNAKEQKKRHLLPTNVLQKEKLKPLPGVAVH